MELTREEIIKALECCSNRVKAKCDECPIGEKRSCAIELYSKALGLIKELTEEVADLKAIAEQYQKQFEEAKADTVRKMHSEIKECCIKGGIYPAFVASTIDKIAKEMLEGEQ